MPLRKLTYFILNPILVVTFAFFQTALAKQEDMEMKLQEVQRDLEHSKGKVALLKEKL